MSRRSRPFIEFTDKDGRPAGRAAFSETGGLANKHFKGGRRAVLCPSPGCTEKFAPVCPNIRCQGSKVPRAMMRLEKIDYGTLSTDEARANVARLQREAHGLPAPKPERPRPADGKRQRRDSNAPPPRRPRLHVATERKAAPPRNVASERDGQRLQAHFDRRRAA